MTQPSQKVREILTRISDDEWKELIEFLILFAHYHIRGNKTWKGTHSTPSRMAEDLVYKAIEQLYLGIKPWRDPQRVELIFFLMDNIISEMNSKSNNDHS
jgi:hypothetical protein